MRAGVIFNSVLLVLWLSLLGWLAWQGLNPPQTDLALSQSATDTEQSLQVAGLESVEFQVPDLEHYSEAIERPLFYPERRPPEPEPEDEPEPEPEDELEPEPESELTLIGVVMMPQTTTALVKLENTQKVVSMRVGDKVESWQLQKINAENVVLAKADESKTLALERNKRKPKLRRRSLKQPATRETDKETEETTEGQEPAKTEQASAEPVDEVVNEKLKQRQERLRIIAERRKKLRERLQSQSRAKDN